MNLFPDPSDMINHNIQQKEWDKANKDNAISLEIYHDFMWESNSIHLKNTPIEEWINALDKNISVYREMMWFNFNKRSTLWNNFEGTSWFFI